MTKVKRKPGKHALHFNDKHLTKQDHGGNADINNIAQQYAQGRLPYPENPPLRYGDISTLDIQRSREILAELDSSFAELPSEVRDKFQTTENYIAWIDENAPQIDSDGLKSTLWDHVHPQDEIVAPGASEGVEPEISANAPENGAAGDDPLAT